MVWRHWEPGGRRVCEHTLPLAVAALAQHVDAAGVPTIAAADEGGTVLCFGLTHMQPTWRLRLSNSLALSKVRRASLINASSVEPASRTVSDPL